MAGRGAENLMSALTETRAQNKSYPYLYLLTFSSVISQCLILLPTIISIIIWYLTHFPVIFTMWRK